MKDLKRYGFEKVVKNFHARFYEKQDYDTAKKWWFSQNNSEYDDTAILHEGLLPDTGVVIENNGEPIAMGWVHLSNSKLAMISWVVSKPDIGPRTRIAAVDAVLYQCEKIARNAGYLFVKIQSDKPGLSKMVHGAGYTPMRPHDIFAKVLGDDDV